MVDWMKLLSNPIVMQKLPDKFDPKEEAEYLDKLYTDNKELQSYKYLSFVHAGGSGMVFKVTENDSGIEKALKIVRKKVFYSEDSPISKEELSTLKELSHPNIVRLFDVIKDKDNRNIGLCTTFIDNPQGMDEYLRDILKKEPKGKTYLQFSPERLERACEHIHHWFSEIANALKLMHESKIYHFDIKPANILVASKIGGYPRAILTDMGSCVNKNRIPKGCNEIRVHFTWAYAHDELTDLKNKPGSIDGGAVRASANVNIANDFAKYDLFSLGKTIQEVLAILQNEFGEYCFASYSFRFLHLITCMLLDGKNAPGSASIYIKEKNGIKFVNDVAMGYSYEMFSLCKIKDADELIKRLKRFRKDYSINELAPEFDIWQTSQVNAVVNSSIPFTKRVEVVMNHPAVRRLKQEQQLGWIREVYPGATHDRWAHTSGVLAATVSYYKYLLSDGENPTLKIIVNADDISHCFLAALLHDIGQTAFGHDFEEACGEKFLHISFIEKMLDDTYWGEVTLRNVIETYWKGIDLKRVMRIIGNKTISDSGNILDSLASDIIDSTFDADKIDYIQRDSIYCGVPYGKGVDVERLVKSLSVYESNKKIRLTYKEKGRAAIYSLLLARYQMFSSVYWHHTFRCIQSMFVHAAASAFGNISKVTGKKFLGKYLRTDKVVELYYHRVICCKPWKKCCELVKNIPIEFLECEVPPLIKAEKALDFIWRFSDQNIREFLNALAHRCLYKRAFEVNSTSIKADYHQIADEFTPEKRLEKAEKLQKVFLKKIEQVRISKVESNMTSTEINAKEQFELLKISHLPLVILDFPQRGVVSNRPFPPAIGDATRKYSVFTRNDKKHSDNMVASVKKLQEELATVRVFVEPTLHAQIIRYLQPQQINECVESVITMLNSD